MVENNRQEEKHRITGNMRDRDHNCYKTVIIGNQEWMAENMRATRDRNGNPIELSKKESIDTPYRYFPHDSKIQRHGYLYNWEAAMKVCPQGWHLPTDEDWEQLEKYVGSQKKYVCDKYNNKTNIAKALADTIGWYGTNNYYERSFKRSFTFGTIGDYLKANNATGFSARSVPQESMVDYYTASFWSATDERNDNRVIARVLRYNIATLWSVPMPKDDKASVRCIRDNCQ